MLRADEVRDLLLHVVLIHNSIEDIGPVKARNKLARIEKELLHDLFPRLLICRCGECNSRHLGKSFLQNRKLAVFRPEIMSPDAHAVRFVNRKERNPELLQKREHGGHQKAFRRNIKQVNFAAPNLVSDFHSLFRQKRRIQICRPYAKLLERIHLIVHERN